MSGTPLGVPTRGGTLLGVLSLDGVPTAESTELPAPCEKGTPLGVLPAYPGPGAYPSLGGTPLSGVPPPNAYPLGAPLEVLENEPSAAMILVLFCSASFSSPPLGIPVPSQGEGTPTDPGWAAGR